MVAVNVAAVGGTKQRGGNGRGVREMGATKVIGGVSVAEAAETAVTAAVFQLLDNVSCAAVAAALVPTWLVETTVIEPLHWWPGR